MELTAVLAELCLELTLLLLAVEDTLEEEAVDEVVFDDVDLAVALLAATSVELLAATSVELLVVAVAIESVAATSSFFASSTLLLTVDVFSFAAVVVVVATDDDLALTAVAVWPPDDDLVAADDFFNRPPAVVVDIFCFFSSTFCCCWMCGQFCAKISTCHNQESYNCKNLRPAVGNIIYTRKLHCTYTAV